MLDSSSTGEPATSQRPGKDVRKAIWTIVTGVALPCIPILAILTLLLSLIYSHKIDPWLGYPEFRLNVTTAKAHHTTLGAITDFRLNGGYAAYLVRYNPSTLTTIASFTSRIIPYLTSSIMALVTFFAAGYIVQQSNRGNDAVLPNPEQLALLIGLLGGSGLEPMKDTLVHRWLKKERLIHPVPAVLWVFLFITFLSILIPLVDAWFGVATHPATVTLFTNTTTKQTFGRQLFREGVDAPCPTGPRTNAFDLWGIDTYWPCNVLFEPTEPLMMMMKNPTEATSLQLGLPVSTTLSTYSVGTTHWIFYSDSKIDKSLDFNASAPAVSTKCFPMTRRCVQGYNNEADTYSCTSGFRVNLTSPWPYTVSNETAPFDNPVLGSMETPLTGIAFASDADLSSTPGLVKNATVGGYGGWEPMTWPEIIPSNPAHFGTWARNYPGRQSISTSLGSDPDINHGPNGDFEILWFLNCTTTVANVTYTWVNGSFLTFIPELVPPDTAALFTSPFSLIGVEADFQDAMVVTLSTMARKAGLSESMDDLAATWALEFSRNAMALGVGAFTPLQTGLEQQRTESVIVARVPVGPLYLLVSLKLLYVVAVVALAIGAYAFTHPAEIEVVKEQLSTKGLAASYFDQPQLLQQSAVKTTQETLDMENNGQSNENPSGSTNSRPPSMVKISRVETLPRDLDGGKPRVGLAPGADGAWRFVMLANGVWHSIEPIVKTFAVNEAKQGKLGNASDLISTWR